MRTSNFSGAHIAGVDLTIKHPAIVVVEKGVLAYCSVLMAGGKTLHEQYPDVVQWYVPPSTQSDLAKWRRNENVAKWIADRLLAIDPAFTAIEGYAHGMRGRGFTDLVETTSLVQDALWHNGKGFKKYPPSTVKLFATGRGNATKEAMVTACLKQAGIDFSIYHTAAEHLADAYWCACLAEKDMAARISREPIKGMLGKPVGTGKNKRPPLPEWPIIHRSESDR